MHAACGRKQLLLERPEEESSTKLASKGATAGVTAHRAKVDGDTATNIDDTPNPPRHLGDYLKSAGKAFSKPFDKPSSGECGQAACGTPENCPSKKPLVTSCAISPLRM